MTPLFFTENERALLKGTNVYSAAAERERDWKAEWEAVRDVLVAGKEADALKAGFTW